MIVPHLVAAAILGGFGRRVAGGLLEDINNGQRTPGGDYPVRAIYAFVMADVALLHDAGWWSVAIFVAVFVGACMGSPWGRSGGGKWWWQAWDGFLAYVWTAAVLVGMQHWAGAGLVLVAGSAGAVVVMKYVFPLKLSGNPTEWVWGALMGASLAAALAI